MDEYSFSDHDSSSEQEQYDFILIFSNHQEEIYLSDPNIEKYLKQKYPEYQYLIESKKIYLTPSFNWVDFQAWLISQDLPNMDHFSDKIPAKEMYDFISSLDRNRILTIMKEDHQRQINLFYRQSNGIIKRRLEQFISIHTTSEKQILQQELVKLSEISGIPIDQLLEQMT